VILGANGVLTALLKRFGGGAGGGSLSIKKETVANTQAPLFNVTIAVADA
jgi:hypothetical protein